MLGDIKLRIDGFIPNANTTLNSDNDVLSGLKPGDTVRAQVLENSGSELTLKLSDGSTVLASAMTPVEASEGEFVNFIYRGTLDGKPALEVAVKAMQPQADQTIDIVKNTLAALKLPLTDQNIQLALALKSQNLPLTAETMAKVTNLTGSNTDIKPNTAAFLAAANMSGDTNSIEKLQSLLAGRLKLNNDIAELLRFSETISDTKLEVPVKAQVTNEILQKLSFEIAAKSDNKANQITQANYANQINQSDKAAANTIVEPAANSLVKLYSTSAEDSKMNATAKNVNVPVNETSDNEIMNNTNKTAEQIIKSNDKSTVIEQIRNLIKGDVPLTKVDIPLMNVIKAEVLAMAAKSDLSQDQQIAAKTIMNEIDNIIFKLKNDNQPESKAQIVDTNKPVDLKSFHDAVSELKNLVVKINQNSDEINPVKLYNELDEALQNIKSTIHQLPLQTREAAMNIANNLESNMNFINQLNNYSSYIQLPLSIFNQNTTGELYMLKKGSKSKKLDPSSMTILLSLDTSNLGRIDTLLSIDKKNIATNFRLEKSDAFKILKNSHKMLYTSLLEKGYRLVDFTYRLIEEPINIVNFESEAKKEFIKSSNTIDVTI